MALLFLVLALAGVVLWVFAYGPGKPDPVARRESIGAQPDGVSRAATPETGHPLGEAGDVAVPADRAGADGCAAEAVLVGRLLAGTLARPDYHRAMAALAAADAARHPIDVPPDRIG